MAKPKLYGNRYARHVNATTIMRREWFRRGYVDAQHKKGFSSEYELARPRDQESYERGRLLAVYLLGSGAVLPRIMSAADGRKVNRMAVRALRDAIVAKAVI